MPSRCASSGQTCSCSGTGRWADADHFTADADVHATGLFRLAVVEGRWCVRAIGAPGGGGLDGYSVHRAGVAWAGIRCTGRGRLGRAFGALGGGRLGPPCWLGGGGLVCSLPLIALGLVRCASVAGLTCVAVCRGALRAPCLRAACSTATHAHRTGAAAASVPCRPGSRSDADLNADRCLKEVAKNNSCLRLTKLIQMRFTPSKIT